MSNHFLTLNRVDPDLASTPIQVKRIVETFFGNWESLNRVCFRKPVIFFFDAEENSQTQECHKRP
jgi:hypothetical protein